jgi:bifunctional DNA-binding transcriptional regulator/antitoxin component of YhaV-PrlF toxin-antitoxin module
MPYVVGSKGQIVISKDIRDKLGVESGWIAIQRLVGDHVEMYLFPPEHCESLKGSLRAHLKGGIAAGEEWDAARETAWGKAAREKTS